MALMRKTRKRSFQAHRSRTAETDCLLVRLLVPFIACNSMRCLSASSLLFSELVAVTRLLTLPLHRKLLSHVCFPDPVSAAAASIGLKCVFSPCLMSCSSLHLRSDRRRLEMDGFITFFNFLCGKAKTLTHFHMKILCFESQNCPINHESWPNQFLFSSFFSLPEPRAADHEKVGPLQYRASALLLLLQRRQGQSAAALLPRPCCRDMSCCSLGRRCSQNGTAGRQRWRRGAFI